MMMHGLKNFKFFVSVLPTRILHTRSRPVHWILHSYVLRKRITVKQHNICIPRTYLWDPSLKLYYGGVAVKEIFTDSCRTVCSS